MKLDSSQPPKVISRPGVPRWVLVAVAVLAAFIPAGELSTAIAQTAVPALVDTLDTASGDTINESEFSGLSNLQMSAVQNGNLASVSLFEPTDFPFLLDFGTVIKSGVKSDVRVNKFYGDLENTLSMKAGSRFTNNLNFSWDDFRQQDKTIETRGAKANYSASGLLPLSFSANGSWDWSKDQTINNAGFANLSKRDFKTGAIRVSKSKLDLGPLRTTFNSSLGINDQKSLNMNQRNDSSETKLNGGAQVGADLASGLTVASRFYGSTASGDRYLGDNNSGSTAAGDSAGVGIYFDQDFTSGRLAITRSNFDNKYLDYKRNSTGQIDTVGLDEFDKVIGELETKDAVSIEFETKLRLGRWGLKTNLSQDSDEQAYAASGVGSKERQSNDASFGLTFGTKRDSFALNYSYLWKWDDQRIKNATENRGRQYMKNRDLDFFYGRTLFKDTALSCKLHQGLGQDIAENLFNTNDKDRLRNDVTVELTRNWSGKFKAKMLFGYKQSQEISIRSTRSSNNNTKDSYEVSPSFTWPVASWLTLSQTYRVYIQYTDYLYSDLESVTRNDDYNKRGNLNSIVVITPTERLELAIRHDFNKRSNATRVLTDVTGNSYYHTDQRQAINNIDLGAVFKVVPGVTLETATFRSRDFKEIFGTSVRETEVFSGEIWIGAKVNRKWGADNPLELSAIVKKFNAFGPAVTEASRDYWEADVLLKWEF